jgi:hypothetical protein
MNEKSKTYDDSSQVVWSFGGFPTNQGVVGSIPASRANIDEGSQVSIC